VRTVVETLRYKPVFLWLAFLVPAASVFGHYLAPNKDILRGHDWGIIAAFALAIVVFFSWIPYQSTGRWPTHVFAFFLLTAGAWAYQVVRTQMDGSLFNLTAFIAPLLLLLLALKRPSKRDLVTALLLLAYSLAVISFLTLSLGTLGLTPSGFAVSDGGGNRIWMLEQFGLVGRWGGPFGSVNYAAPVGGLILIVGIASRGVHRTILLPAGLLILTISQGRTALFAVTAALLVFFLWSPRFQRLPNHGFIRILILALTALGVAGYILSQDPTFNGRTPIWADFSGLLVSNPIFGVGTTGVIDFVVENTGQPGFIPHTHAHSVLLDGVTRYGLIFGALTLAIYALALISSAKASPENGSGPMALTVFVIVSGSAETIYSWNYWSIYVAVLTYVVLISACAKRETYMPEKDVRSPADT